MPLSTGQVLNNRYRIVKLLGQGGFGAVYRAWDINLNGPCALKENFDTSPAAQAQFQREASMLFNLRHPNLPKVSDSFTIPGQGQYLVMEYIDWEDLAHLLERTGTPLPEAQALSWIMQVCDALIYLHTQTPAIIHRDLKPANIRITPQGQAVLVDFGIAKAYDPKLRTTYGARAVTPGYSPVEQYLSQGRTDARTDIYSLGATLYTLLTCQAPPEAPERNMGVGLPAIRAFNPSVSAGTEAALFKALEMAPDRRYQSAAEFRWALSAGPATVMGGLAGSSGYTAGANPPASPAAPLAQRATVPWKWFGLLGGLILVSLVVWGILSAGGNDEGQDQAQASLTALAELHARETQAAMPIRTEPLVETAVATLSPSMTFTPESTFTPTPSETPAYTATPLGFPGMVLVPAGEFQMGVSAEVALRECVKFRGSCDKEWFYSEEPAHIVYLDDYFIDVHEVTNAEYVECVAAGACSTPSQDCVRFNVPDYTDPANADYPKVCVDWQQARAYCEWQGGSLPTEAQWEKAARGTDGRTYPWGDMFNGLRLNFCDKNCPNPNGNMDYDDGYAYTAPVGSYPSGASPYGVLDMAGNVWEWVWDWYSETYYSISPVNNPTGPAFGDVRVMRGGGYFDDAPVLRMTQRMWDDKGCVDCGIAIGFRCARMP